ncbi:MAG: hypothetical protein JKY71_07355 [Alphaproteobacteria bacterium]|nr:hypothetical protein [Alphaproteobacteria bacterium]|tara:strand:+ start:1025 stop:1468 length:444 start_codon:yes stop_codon:yes gene_type:complete
MHIKKTFNPEKNQLFLAIFLTLFLAFSFPALAETGAGTEHAHSSSKAYEYSWLEKVEPEYVCMVNDQKFPNVQIPVEVNGKTYYGCCQMCKAKLENVQEIREGRDPISGDIVDKAIAVIGSGPDGAVYYFENEQNLKLFDTQMADQQ